jgi:hypothetical protein
MEKSVTFKDDEEDQEEEVAPPMQGRADSLSKKRCDKLLESMQGLREIYDNAHRVHMMSCFQQIPPSLWEKYLDELHPLIREAKNKSAEAVPVPQVPVPQVPTGYVQRNIQVTDPVSSTTKDDCQ